MAKEDSNLTVFLCVLDIKEILKKNLKSSWILFIIRVLIKSVNLLKHTRWGTREYAAKNVKEVKYAKTVIILAAMYLHLIKRLQKEKALEVMRQVIMQLSYSLDYAVARKNQLFTIPDPFERWIRYRSGLITDGFGLHNEIEDVYISNERMHYIVRRCIFHDVFSEAHVPELTSLICDYDRTFHSTIFKEFYFDRNGSWKNTIGHGAEICHYVWKDRRILSEEFKQYLQYLESSGETETENKSGDEKRKFVRRQYDRRQGDRRKFDRRDSGNDNVESCSHSRGNGRRKADASDTAGQQ